MFVVLEGADGVGKTTQLELLTTHKEYKTARELGSFESYLPKGTDLKCRDLIDRLYGKVSQATIAGLYRANRGVVQDLYVKPLLAQGHTVVMDRWNLSSYIYCKAKQTDLLLAIGLLVDPTCLLPDLTIILNRDSIDLSTRPAGNGLFEDLGDDFTSMVRQEYRQFRSYFWTDYHNDKDLKHKVVHLNTTAQAPIETCLDIVQLIETHRSS